MTDAQGHPSAPLPDDWEELEPQREWTPADRLRLVAWVLIGLNILAVLLFAPVGDGAIVQIAEHNGVHESAPRLTYWVTLLVSTLLGNAVGAAAAATKQRWAIVPPVFAALGCWAGFAIGVVQAG